MVGTVAVVTGIAGPIGQAVARRLAGESRCILFSDANAQAARPVLAEVERIRALHGLEAEPVFVEADAATDAGARLIIRTALSTFGRVDAVVVNGEVTVRNGAGDGALSVDLASFVPAVRMAGAALERQPEGNVVLTALLRGAWPGRLGEAACKVAVSSFGAFVHAAATALHDRGVTLNGVAMEDPARADHTLDMAALGSAAAVRVDRQRRSHQLYDAAYTTRFLASSEARGVTGQVLLLSGGGTATPPYTRPAESAAYSDLFRHIERLPA
ncbi:MAG: SDR family oxidoreductase [Rhodothermales bacterium]